MQVLLDAETEGFVREIMASGGYETPESVMAAAIEALLQKKAQLTAELRKGVDQIERGETVPYDPVTFMAAYKERRAKGLGYTREDSAAISPPAG